jgi:Rrf2 family transcriptional regulator, nitric oxide-sensitive transcriptional repressor
LHFKYHLYTLVVMQLTQFSDIGLRLLMYLAKEQRESPAITLAEVSSQFDIPRNHVAKVAGKLIKHGWVSGTRGRSGGLHLATLPSRISLGQVLKVLEGHEAVIDCEKLQCKLKGGCELRSALAKAYGAFFDVLDEYTLADVIQGSAGNQIITMHNGFMALYLGKSSVQ